MRIGVPRELHPGERRVAAVPLTVERWKKLGFEVMVERGAGEGASVPDDLYVQAGATLADRGDVLASDLVVCVRAPSSADVDVMRPGSLLIALLAPAQNGALLDQLAARGVDALALERIPRSSRAQKADVLSSMANVAGYRAVIEAAHAYGSFLGGQMTAAGKTPPAQVLVIGAGVAGLAAVGAARGLGAEVRAFDVRKSVADEIKSMGARFLPLEFDETGDGGGGYARQMSDAFLEAERTLFQKQAPDVDIIISTALIPGKTAPLLLTDEILGLMKPGSVVIDMAAEAGGNAEGTVAGQIVVRKGVTLVGYTDLPSRLPGHASRYFGNNVANLLQEMGGGEKFALDLTNDVVGPAIVVHNGLRLPDRPPPPVTAGPAAAPAAPVAGLPVPAGPSPWRTPMGVLGLLLVGAAAVNAPPGFLQHLTVFVLACFIGWQVIWNVSASLHTPLMAVTNAISGIIVAGGMLAAASTEAPPLARILGGLAIALAAVNIGGGFLVTRRMLAMFHKNPGSSRRGH